MNKYKVKVIQMALRNNKLAKSGDVVSEAQLTGKASDLVKAGYIVPEDDSKAKAKAKAEAEAKAKEEAEAKAKAEAEAKEAFDKAYEEGTLNADQLDSITKAEIYEYAKKHSLKFNEDAKKAELIAQVLKAEKVEE